MSPLESLKKLKVVNLEINQIELIKPLHCPELRILNLSNNQIRKIENLEMLSGLKSLNLYRNAIEEIG